MRDCMDRRVTLPKRVTSLTWGPPPPCKQALSVYLPYLPTSNFKKFPQLFCIVQEGKTFEESVTTSNCDAT